MTRFRVGVTALGEIEVEASTESEAIEMAQDCLIEDINLDWDYEAEEIPVVGEVSDTPHDGG